MSNIIPFPADKARSVIDRVVEKMDERDRETRRLKSLAYETECRAQTARTMKDAVAYAREAARLREQIKRREMGGE